jgi:hypothetical protein
MHEQWMRPKELNLLDVVFATDVSHLMPSYNEIPEDFRREKGEAQKWVDIVNDWFFLGMKNIRWVVKHKDIDKAVAVNHLMAIMQSWEPQHEHKIAGVAYLMSLWFDDVTYERAK